MRRTQSWEISHDGLRLLVTSPAPREAWDELLQADERAIPSQSPAWTDCICAFGAYDDASRLYEAEDGKRFVLPLIRRAGAPLTATQASLPRGWGFGGLVAPTEPTPAEAAAVLADLAQRVALSTLVRPNPLATPWTVAPSAETVVVPRLAHVLDLHGGFDVTWTTRFTNDTRYGVRKAERSGVELQRDTTGRMLPIFYELYERSLDRWAQKQREPVWLTRLRGRRRDPRRKFELIAKTLGSACRIWVATVEGRPAAASLVIQGGNAWAARGVMDRELAGPTRANDLLETAAIREACEAQCRYYHMGETGASRSLAHYKTRFGAQAYPYVEFRFGFVRLARADTQLRTIVKRMIGFHEPAETAEREADRS